MGSITNACNARSDGGDLPKLPWLASPSLKFDLFRELQELRNSGSINRETGRSSRTLAKHPDFRLVLVLMKANTRMTQHRAEGRISIYQLLGSACVSLPHEEINLVAGELLVLDGGVLHDIEALEESAFLLTIAWRGDKVSLREAQKASEESTFDEEALLRMEDEGAPNRARPPDPWVDPRL